MILNIGKVTEYKKELEDYNGLLPLLIIPYIDNGKYINNLKKKNLFYNHVQEEMFRVRRIIQFLSDESLWDYEKKELITWVENNPQYKDVVNQL